RLNSKSLAGKLKTLPPKTLKIPLDPYCPELHDTHPERCVAQAVLGVVSRAVATASIGGNRRQQLPESSPRPIRVFSVHPLSHGLGPSFFGLRRSSPADSVQPVRPSPVQQRRFDPI
ncbi:hypothetical protein CRG98_048113, partial [Punica granatum]